MMIPAPSSEGTLLTSAPDHQQPTVCASGELVYRGGGGFNALGVMPWGRGLRVPWKGGNGGGRHRLEGGYHGVARGARIGGG